MAVAPIITAVSSGISALGGLRGRGGRERSSARNLRLSREDSRIQRLVKDAKLAGVHPLYAMGAGVSSGGPSFLTSGSSGKDAVRVARGVSAGMRSIQAGKTTPEDAARIELMGKQGSYYDALTVKALSDVARANSPGGGPLQLAMPGVQLSTGGEPLPVEGGVMPRRTYRSPMFGNISFKEGSPTAQQREDEAGEIMGNLDSFVSYLNSIGRKLGIGASIYMQRKRSSGVGGARTRRARQRHRR